MTAVPAWLHLSPDTTAENVVGQAVDKATGDEGDPVIARYVVEALTAAGHLLAGEAAVEPVDEPRHVLVLGRCGHWWRESQPAGFRMTDAPRVCTVCPIGIRDDEGYSSQGFRLVPVTYLTSWTEHDTKEH